MTIEFEAVFGDQTKKVRLHKPSGAEGWQLIIDNLYNGMLFKRGSKWVARLNNADLTADDVQALGERVDNFIASQNP